MRLRNNPNAFTLVDEHPDIVITFYEKLKKSWYDIFHNDNPLFIEIGIGKGDFIFKMAELYPNYNFIGIEKYTTVMGVALKKLLDNPKDNVKLFLVRAETIEDFFLSSSVKGIYLNFSDPWPKKRHIKRRLTSPDFLNKYFKLLTNDGLLIMKTDNLDLFEYSLNSLKENKFKLINYTYDYLFDEDKDAMSEYESKFRLKGNKIYRLTAIKGE